MYLTLLTIHSLFRWLVLCSLVFAVYRAYSGWLMHKAFTAFDNRVRHISATIAHVQLIIGVWLYKGKFKTLAFKYTIPII